MDKFQTNMVVGCLSPQTQSYKQTVKNFAKHEIQQSLLGESWKGLPSTGTHKVGYIEGGLPQSKVANWNRSEVWQHTDLCLQTIAGGWTTLTPPLQVHHRETDSDSVRVVKYIHREIQGGRGARLPRVTRTVDSIWSLRD
jgi:hypothetical protein